MATRHENRNPGCRRDPVVRPVLDVGEQNDLALNRRELRERRKQSRPKIGSLEVLHGSFGSLRWKAVLEWNEPLPTDRPKTVERPSMDDREQPRGKPVGLPAGRELLVCVHEGLLRDVVGVGGVAKDGERTRERGAAMPTHQRLERMLLPRQRAMNQDFVGLLGGHAVNRTPAGDRA